jgi:hypothetical protein
MTYELRMNCYCRDDQQEEEKPKELHLAFQPFAKPNFPNEVAVDAPMVPMEP